MLNDNDIRPTKPGQDITKSDGIQGIDSHLESCLRLSDGPRVPFVVPKESSDRALDLQLRGNKLYPGGEGRAHRQRRRRLDMHRAGAFGVAV
jgi:hypothetical protein